MKVNSKFLRDRLTDLNRNYGGLFYWKNGSIRHCTLHPTKGFRDNLWERYAVTSLNGLLMIDDNRDLVAGNGRFK